jgi:hypothetical protein
VWDVVSTLTKVDLLLGEDLVSNLGAVQRAQQQDLDQPQSYQVTGTPGRLGYCLGSAEVSRLFAHCSTYQTLCQLL